jgi:hypothetical protein
MTFRCSVALSLNRWISAAREMPTASATSERVSDEAILAEYVVQHIPGVVNLVIVQRDPYAAIFA